MPINYDGRAELRFVYNTLISGRSLEHGFTIDVNPQGVTTYAPGTPFENVTVTTHDDSDVALQDEVDDLMDVILPLYSDQTEWSRVELWVYGVEPSQDAVFISAYDIAQPGTSVAVADTPASYGLFTFRTIGGGIMKVQLMEWRHALQTRETSPYSLTEFNNLAAHITSENRAWIARDNTRPIARVALNMGTNEKLIRKRFRSA